MLILYLGKFHKEHNTERYVDYALRQHGVQVVRRPFTESMAYSSLIRKVEDVCPDVVLFSKPAAPCFRDFIEYCRAAGILTVCWQWDLFWGYRPQRLPQFKADLLFTTDGGHEDRWKQIGANHQVLRQGIHKPDHQWFDGNYTHDVAFVGNSTAYRERRRLVQWLRNTYRGRFIHHTQTRGLDLNRALARVKIVVGDSFPSPYYWSNRVYEILGRGGFLLMPSTKGLDSEFQDGVHYVSYPRRDFAALKRSISHWINNDEDRERIRRSGFDHCGKEYTYEHRVGVLLEKIRLALDSLPPELEPRPLSRTPTSLAPG